MCFLFQGIPNPRDSLVYGMWLLFTVSLYPAMNSIPSDPSYFHSKTSRRQNKTRLGPAECGIDVL